MVIDSHDAASCQPYPPTPTSLLPLLPHPRPVSHLWRGLLISTATQVSGTHQAPRLGLCLPWPAPPNACLESRAVYPAI